MARIIGGIGTSHVPTIGVAYDRGRQEDPVWAPLFEGYKPVAKWLAEKQADVLLFFYNDHATTLFFDLYPTFALGVGERFPIADEGAGLRGLPDIRGDVDFQAHIGEALVNEEFDLAFFQNKPIDHGIASPLPLLWPHEPDWPGTVVPIAINVLQYPLPTARRCYRLGQAVRRAVRVTLRISRASSSAPEAFRTRSTASARGSTIPSGISISSKPCATIPSG